MIRPGTGLHVVEGSEHRVVDADRDHRHPLGRDVHLCGDVLARVLRHRDHRGQGAGHPHLHAEEAEPAPRRESLPRVRRVRQGELAVDRDGVVQRRQQGPAVLDHAEHPGAEALVVMDDVELVAALRQELAGPERVGQGLPEAGRAHDGELGPVLPGGELAPVRDAEGIGLAVEVEAADGGEPDPLVELGPGRAGEHLDRVAQGDQLAGQVAGVDPLATATGVTPVDEEGDTQTSRSGRRGGNRGGKLNVARALPGFLCLDPLLARRFRQRMSRLDSP